MEFRSSHSSCAQCSQQVEHLLSWFQPSLLVPTRIMVKIGCVLRSWSMSRQRSLKEEGTITKGVFEKSWDFRPRQLSSSFHSVLLPLLHTLKHSVQRSRQASFKNTKEIPSSLSVENACLLCPSEMPLGVYFIPFCALGLDSRTQ